MIYCKPLQLVSYPTTSTISFTHIPTNSYTFTLVNATGRQVHQSVVEIAKGKPINVSWLPDGVYFIHLVNAAIMERYQFKFLKVEDRTQ